MKFLYSGMLLVSKSGVLLIFLIVLTSFTGCDSMQSKNVEFPEFDKQGHRGARGLMPENTVAGMLKAIDLGVTTLEMDIHVTRDQQVVLSHDPQINSSFTFEDGAEIDTSNRVQRVIFQMDYPALDRYDVGSKAYKKFPRQHKVQAKIPLLSQVIDSVQLHLNRNNKNQVFYNLETKSILDGDGKFHPDPETFVDLLVQVLQEKKIMPWVIIQSFDPRTLEVVHRKYPGLKTAFLVENGTLKENLKRLSFAPTIYSPAYKLVDKALIEACHAGNMKIIPWTVNTKTEIKRLKDIGVDGIITDYPDLFNQGQ